MSDIIRGTHVIIGRHINARQHEELLKELTAYVSEVYKFGFSKGALESNKVYSENVFDLKDELDKEIQENLKKSLDKMKSIVDKPKEDKS